MNIENVKEVFSDEAFVKELFEMETASQVQAALKEKGIELTEAEILEIRDTLAKVESGELTEDMLENVAGGITIAGIISIIVAVAAGGGSVCGLVFRW
jgi:hypothetical protein